MLACESDNGDGLPSVLEGAGSWSRSLVTQTDIKAKTELLGWGVTRLGCRLLGGITLVLSVAVLWRWRWSGVARRVGVVRLVGGKSFEKILWTGWIYSWRLLADIHRLREGEVAEEKLGEDSRPGKGRSHAKKKVVPSQP